MMISLYPLHASLARQYLNALFHLCPNPLHLLIDRPLLWAQRFPHGLKRLILPTTHLQLLVVEQHYGIVEVEHVISLEGDRLLICRSRVFKVLKFVEADG